MHVVTIHFMIHHTPYFSSKGGPIYWDTFFLYLQAPPSAQYLSYKFVHKCQFSDNITETMEPTTIFMHH